MNRLYSVQTVRFRKNALIVTVNKKEYHFDLTKVSRKLARAGKKERERFEITPSGYGIHWPLLDEDLSIDALIKSTEGLASVPLPPKDQDIEI